MNGQKAFMSGTHSTTGPSRALTPIRQAQGEGQRHARHQARQRAQVAAEGSRLNVACLHSRHSMARSPRTTIVRDATHLPSICAAFQRGKENLAIGFQGSCASRCTTKVVSMRSAEDYLRRVDARRPRSVLGRSCDARSDEELRSVGELSSAEVRVGVLAPPAAGVLTPVER